MFSLILVYFYILTNINCSLNGKYINNRCICNFGWKGKNCDILNFKPLNLSQGYHNSSYASWGGNIIYNNNKYHLFVSQIENKCGLEHYSTNSKIIRAESKTYFGPFKYAETIIPTFSHNPSIHKYNDDWILFYIGENRTAINCSSNILTLKQKNNDIKYIILNNDFKSKSKIFNVEFRNTNETYFTNPAPLVDNGTIFLAYQSFLKNIKDRISLSKYDLEKKQFNYITSITKNNPLCLAGMEEDPFIWKSDMGYHMISHGMCPSGFLQSRYHYSLDSINWYQSKNNPYSYSVKLIDNSYKLFFRMERPKIIFDKNNKLVGISLAVCDEGFIKCLIKQSGITYTIVRELI